MELSDTECHTLITTSTYALMPDLNTISITTFPFTGVATPVSVVWGPKDLGSFTPRAAPSIAVANMFNDQTADPSPGLSTGAKAGISVGAAVACLSLLGLGLFFLLIRRRKRRATTPSADIDPKAELPGDSSAQKKLLHEFDTYTEIKEMQGDAVVPELAAQTKRAELDVPHRVHELP